MSADMMKEKWQMTFTLLDFNRDGVLSSKDRDDCKASFQTVFQPEGDKQAAMMADLDKLWELSFFLLDSPDWSKSMNQDEFVASRKATYEANKSGMIEVVRKASEHLFNAGDVTGSKTFTFEELKKLHQAFNIKNEDFIKGVYSLVAPGGGNTCTLDSMVAFYTEFIVGEDATKHEIYKGAFKAAGFM